MSYTDKPIILYTKDFPKKADIGKTFLYKVANEFNYTKINSRNDQIVIVRPAPEANDSSSDAYSAWREICPDATERITLTKNGISSIMVDPSQGMDMSSANYIMGYDILWVELLGMSTTFGYVDLGKYIEKFKRVFLDSERVSISFMETYGLVVVAGGVYIDTICSDIIQEDDLEMSSTMNTLEQILVGKAGIILDGSDYLQGILERTRGMLKETYCTRKKRRLKVSGP